MELDIDIKELIGKTFDKVVNVNNEQLIFKGKETYIFYHCPDCCETVEIEDICGDLNDLVGTPIIKAEERISEGENPEGVPVKEYQDSFTWTFYEFATIKGSVTVRWYGESNGYYSESVDLRKE